MIKKNTNKSAFNWYVNKIKYLITTIEQISKNRANNKAKAKKKKNKRKKHTYKQNKNKNKKKKLKTKNTIKGKKENNFFFEKIKMAVIEI